MNKDIRRSIIIVIILTNIPSYLGILAFLYYMIQNQIQKGIVFLLLGMGGGIIVHGVWNTVAILRGHRKVVQVEIVPEGSSAIEPSQQDSVVDETEQSLDIDIVLDRSTQITHLRYALKINTWKSLFKHFFPNLLYPSIKPFDFAIRLSSNRIDAIAYSWFLTAILISVALYIYLNYNNVDLSLSLTYATIPFVISLRPIVMASEVSPYQYPHSYENIVLLLAISGIASTYFGSLSMALLLFGEFVGHILQDDLHDTFDEDGLNFKHIHFSFALCLVLGVVGGLISIFISRFVVSIIYALLLSLLVAGIIRTFWKGNTPKHRSEALGGALFLTALISVVVLVASIRFLSLVEAVLFVASLWISFSGHVIARILNAYKDPRSKFSFAFHMFPKNALNELMILILFYFFFVGLFYAFFVQHATRLQGLLSIGAAIISLPLIVYGLHFYVFIAMLFSIQYFWLIVRLYMGAKLDILSAWKSSIGAQVQGLLFTLPFFTPFFAKIAETHGFNSALDALERYTKTSIENKSIIQVLDNYISKGHSVYDLLSWGLSKDLIPELVLLGRKNRLMKEAVRLLVILDLIPSDPYQSEKSINIRSKGRLYQIHSSYGTNKASLITTSLDVLKTHASSIDYDYFKRIFYIVHVLQNTQHINELHKIANDLEDAILLHSYLPHEEQKRRWFLQMSCELSEMIRCYSLSGQERLRAIDRDWLQEKLSSLQSDETLSQRSIVGLLSVFVLIKIEQMQV